jgi:hypothetical protein
MEVGKSRGKSRRRRRLIIRTIVCKEGMGGKSKSNGKGKEGQEGQ